MPEICRFDGIVISMHWADHQPPHFHARFGRLEASIVIDSLVVLDGRLPRPQLRQVRAWAGLRRAELIEDWHRARQLRPLEPIAPLP